MRVAGQGREAYVPWVGGIELRDDDVVDGMGGESANRVRRATHAWARPAPDSLPGIPRRDGPLTIMSSATQLQQLADRWAGARAAERANAQSYMKELCRALGTEEPRPAGSGYEFEFPVRAVGRDGAEATNFIDLYKAGCFALEAKDEAEGASNDRMLR